MTARRSLLAALLIANAPCVAAAPGDARGSLIAAAARGDAAAVSALLQGGASANVRDASGRPALLLAASSRRLDVVRALLGAGASADAADRAGWTALHQAVEQGDLAIAGALLDAGATPDLPSRAAGTALDVAETSGRVELTRLLRARGATGSGKSIGDTVCVRPWEGDGFCGVVEAREPARFRLRIRSVLGCRRGCSGGEACSAGRTVGEVGGLRTGDAFWVAASCLTHTGLQ